MDRSKSEMNLSQLTDEERQSILRVLKRDQALRIMEEKRLMYLRSELHMLKKRGALKPGLDSGSRCARCLTPLGLLLNSGADCFICLKKVCHSCRQNNETSQSKGNSKQWACLVCSKQMEFKAVSGDWMETYKSSKKEGLPKMMLTKILTQAIPLKPNEKTYASVPSQPHFSPNMSIRSAPDSCSKIDPPRRVQFSSGSPQSLTDFKKSPGNSNIPSPPVLKKRPLLSRNLALDHTIDTDGSVLSKLAKVHPEMKLIDDKERLPVSGIQYNKCRSRRDSSSSVSTCSLSSTSLQGPSPRIARKNVKDFSLEVDSKKTSIVNNDLEKENASNHIGTVQLRTFQNVIKSANDRSASEPCYEIKVAKENEIRTLKSHSLGSYDDSHSLQAFHMRNNNNLMSGSFENFSDTTSNSGAASINSSYQSRPSSISPATFRRVLVSSFNDSSSSHSESELESTPKFSTHFPKVCLKKNSTPESTYDENAMAHRSSPRGRLRARNKALSTSSDDGINRTTGAVPQITVSDHIETNSIRGSQSLSDKESIGVPEEDVDQVVSAYSRSQTSLFGARSESMSSVYSAAGGGRYGAVIVTGEILFSMSYNCKAGHLALHVKECRNVAPVDTKRNRSDPYVKVYLLPDKTKGGKRKTKVKKHTLNPVFDEVLKFVVTSSELDTRTIWLSVWHSDIFGRNDFLGEVTLPLSSKIVDNAQALKWYPLQERMDSVESSLTYKGDIILSLKFVPPDVTSKKPSRKGSNCSTAGTKGTLHVLVKEARNLMAMRSNGTSDPFCKSYLLPDKSKSGKQKTPVVKKSCNPKWNHTFVYEDISTEELKDRCLELTIWDYDKITSNDFLGGVRMNLGTGKYQGKDVDWMDAMGEELVLWRSMVDRPNQWIDAALMLRPSMSRRP